MCIQSLMDLVKQFPMSNLTEKQKNYKYLLYISALYKFKIQLFPFACQVNTTRSHLLYISQKLWVSSPVTRATAKER
jgi:hypothetical protein